MDYLLVKAIHIISSVLLVGTGLGSAFYLYFANRSGSVAAIAVVARLVVRADWCFTTPTIIIQPLSGLYLIHLSHYPLSWLWIWAAIALYALAGACWLPVVAYQIKMSKLALAAQATSSPLPAAYWRYARRWELLGYPAFIAMLAIYLLMVLKPM